MTHVDVPVLVTRLRDAATDVFAGKPVLFAYVFGSQIVGQPRSDSDVDVAVMLRETADSDAAARQDASVRLADELGHAAGVGRIEALVVLNDAALSIAGRVVRDGLVIHSADDVARVRHYSDTMRRFGDWELHQRRHVQDRLDAMAAMTAHG